jgi:hypothetical protein
MRGGRRRVKPHDGSVARGFLRANTTAFRMAHDPPIV